MNINEARVMLSELGWTVASGEHSTIIAKGGVRLHVCTDDDIVTFAKFVRAKEDPTVTLPDRVRPGMTVQLESGGPKMTASKVLASAPDWIDCVWWDEERKAYRTARCAMISLRPV